MNPVVIKDLSVIEVLDRNAMAAVHGGLIKIRGIPAAILQKEVGPGNVVDPVTGTITPVGGSNGEIHA